MTPDQLRMLTIVFGAIVCCLGWTIYWGSVKFFGSIVGLVLGIALGLAGVVIIGIDQYAIRLIIVVVIGIGGLVCGVLFFKRLHYLFFFAIGASLAVFIANLQTGTSTTALDDFLMIINFRDASPLYRMLLKFFFAAFLGLLFGLLSKIVVVVLAALLGTGLIVHGAGNSLPEYFIIPIFLTSLILQLGLLKKFPPHPALESQESRGSKKEEKEEKG